MHVYQIQFRSGAYESVEAEYWDLDGNWFDFYTSTEPTGFIRMTVCAELVKSITRVDVTAEPAA